MKNIVFEYTLFDDAVRIVSFANACQNRIFEVTHENLTILSDYFSLSVQEPIPILSLLKFTLRYISAITIKLDLIVFHYHFSISDHILIRWQVFPPRASNTAYWIEVIPIFNLNKFLNASYSIFVTELESSFIFELFEVEFVFDERVEEEFVAIGFLEEVICIPIEYLLYYLKFVFWFFSEQLFINSPVFKFHSEHVDVFLLLFVNLATISDKISHQIKSIGISINEYFVILFLKGVPSWK